MRVCCREFAYFDERLQLYVCPQCRRMRGLLPDGDHRAAAQIEDAACNTVSSAVPVSQREV